MAASKAQVFAPHESAQLRKVAAWVSQVTNASSPPTGRAQAPSAASSSARELDPLRPLKAASPRSASSPPEQEMAMRRAAGPALDPFDPAIFNQETQDMRSPDDGP